MISTKKKWVPVACILCFIVCVGDTIALYVFGRKYPGYSQVTDTISSLGATISPVSDQISAWWVIIGSAFVVFALGFNEVYKEKGKTVKTAAWLIALYGLGEGMGSGLFKADHIGDSLTTSARIHDVLGGFGSVAALIFPLVMLRVFPKENHRAFYIFSGVVFCVGIVTSLLFLSNHFSSCALSLYTGLWQRLTLIDHYVYFMVVAGMMLRELKQETEEPYDPARSQ
jgi:hypothetical protein